eukprot:5209741-Prymnesium_polylepis.2
MFHHAAALYTADFERGVMHEFDGAHEYPPVTTELRRICWNLVQRSSFSCTLRVAFASDACSYCILVVESSAARPLQLTVRRAVGWHEHVCE